MQKVYVCQWGVFINEKFVRRDDFLVLADDQFDATCKADEYCDFYNSFSYFEVYEFAGDYDKAIEDGVTVVE